MTGSPDSNSDAISELPSRRRFLTAAATTTALAGVGSFAGAAQQSDTTQPESSTSAQTTSSLSTALSGGSSNTSEGNSSGNESGTEAGGPGFGILASLTALGAAGLKYLCDD